MPNESTKVGDYTLLEALEGHDHDVHSARDASGARAIVAMFELSEEGATGVREDYERAKALEHDAIASALDLFEADGKLAMVFEGIAGVSASQALAYLDERSEHLSDGAALKIGLSLCDALHAAHTAKDAEGKVSPLVHAQLGPHQVFLTFDGHVRLLGLGLGTAFRTAAGRGDVPEDAKPYQAPEVLRGGPLTVRGNVYSAGAVLWRLLSRKPLPSAGTAFPPLSGLRSDLPAMLTKAIDSALEPSMLKRRMTCVQLLRAIQHAGLADAEDLRWNLEILEEEVDFAHSTIGVMSFPPAKLSDVPPTSIQPLSSDFPGPDSDAPTNVVAVPPLVPFRVPQSAAASASTSPESPGFLDVVPMPRETPEMAEVRARIAMASTTKPTAADARDEGSTQDEEPPFSADPPTLRPAAIVRAARSAKTPARAAAHATPEPVTRSPRSDDGGGGIVLTPERWLGSVIAVAGLCSAFLIVGIVIGRTTVTQVVAEDVAEDVAEPPSAATERPEPQPVASSAPPPSPAPPPTAEAPVATASASAAPEPSDEEPLPPIGHDQGHLLVKTSHPDAHVYVAGRPSGLPGEVLVVPCGVRNVRIGMLPLIRWLSPSKAFNLVCGRKTTLWLESDRAIQVMENPGGAAR